MNAVYYILSSSANRNNKSFLVIFNQVIPRFQINAVRNYTSVSLYSYNVEPTVCFKSKNIISNGMSPSNLTVRNFVNSETTKPDIKDLVPVKIEELILNSLSSNRFKEINNILNQCMIHKKYISKLILRKVVMTCSYYGNVETILTVQEYMKINASDVYEKNGQFLHYLAKAHCMRGNIDKGLILLKYSYVTYLDLRSVHRFILRELIFDLVSNRSEASMLTFKRHLISYVDWNDNYPMVCLWNTCWISSWYSDQKMAEDMMDESEHLQSAVSEMAVSFTWSFLKNKYNEDAVLRLLQALLKYHKMEAYSNVIQILFISKLKNRDIRGCTEIIRNCRRLNIKLPADYQEKYLTVLIKDSIPIEDTVEKKETPKFKLKF